MSGEIINKVDEKGLITLNLEEYYDQGERVIFDIKDLLFEGLILRERDFRDFVKKHDWAQYQDCNVAVDCTADAIIPMWAYMLISTQLKPYAAKVCIGNKSDLNRVLFSDAINAIDLEHYRDAVVMVNGCSKYPVPESAFAEISMRLADVVKTLSYGEACSKVPVYKKRRS